MKNQRGATLIELVLAIIVISIIAYVVSDAFLYSSKSILAGNAARDATQSARFAVDRMTREIRNVRDKKCIQAATSTAFTFVDMGNNTVTFSWAGAGAPLMRNGNILVDGVSNFSLTYYDNSYTAAAPPPPNVIGAPTTCASPNTCLTSCASTNIWSVSIDLTTQVGGQTTQFRSQVHPISF